MSDNRNGSSGRRARVNKSKYVTKSGKTIKIRRSLRDHLAARQDSKLARKALAMHSLPKGKVKRFFARLHPKRMYHYWFSRQGAVMALKIAGIGVITGALFLLGLFAYFRKDLPNLRDISGNNIGGSMRYYDRTGQVLLWEDYDAVKRIPVKGEDIPQIMKDATIAIEDKDFFKHGGFDVRGIMRAGINNTFGGGDTTQGGSTITQQLVKLTQNWTNDVTYTRKVKELILAIELERSYTKEEILTGYLNTAPYGDITYGVQAAMQDYFHKDAKDMTLDEAAFLAAIPKSPTVYSPRGARYTPDSLLGRQDYVLDLMEQQGMISKEERDEAKEVDTIAKIQPRTNKYTGIKAPWFVLTAKKQLEEKYGGETVSRGGWSVITTLDMNLQTIAEEEVNNGMAQIRRQGGDTTAFVAEDVTNGQVVALVGGSDFNNEEFGEFNYATAQLPPGSSIKPYDYASLIEHTTNFGAGSVLYDSQDPLPGYPCTIKGNPRTNPNVNCLNNYDLRYPGPLTLRYALGGSRNVPAIKAMLTVGIEKTIQTAESLGLKSGYNCYYDEQLTREAPCYASAGIGDGAYLRLDEHVHAYTTLSRNGVKIPQTFILKITDAQGKTVDEWKPEKGEQVIRPDTAYIVSDMLEDPNPSYFRVKPHRYNGWKFAMKTGTTNDAKDAWMMGYSTKYAAGVWTGHHTRNVEMSGSMETMTLPIWQGWMRRAHDGHQPVERQRPSGVQTLPAFVVRTNPGLGAVVPSPATDLYPSWYEPKKRGNTTEKKVIDIISNKLATECTPPRARQEVDESNADAFNGDQWHGGGGNTTEEKDDVHQCSDIKPSITLTVNKLPSGRYQFVATVSQGTHPLSGGDRQGTVNFLVDGQVVNGGSFTVNKNGTITMEYNPSSSGSGTVTAEVIDSVLYDDSDSRTVTFEKNSDNNGNDDDDDDDISLLPDPRWRRGR